MSCSDTTLPRLARLSLVAILLLFGMAPPAAAGVAELKFTAIGKIDGAPVGSFATAGFMNNEVVDMTIQIEETTSDSDVTVGAGTYNDPSSVTTFIGQTSAAMVSFIGFGFQLFNSTRLDQASIFIVPTSGPNPSGQYIRDWDVFDFDPPISNVDNLFTILAELPDVTIKNVPADGFAIRSPDVGGFTTDFLSMTPTVTLEVGCGNGVIDPNEVCDTLCCDATCNNFATGGTLCRPLAGPCDQDEFCPGGSDVCPDTFLNSGVCRPAQSICDLAESCSGSGPACPPDLFTSGGVECRMVQGACDEAEQCTGTDPLCPPDTRSVFTCGTICRPSQDACDQADFCASFADTGNYDCPGEATLCTPSPTVTPTSTPTHTSTLTPTLTPTITQTGTPTGTPTVTSTPTLTGTPTITPTFAPNENSAGNLACSDDFDNDNDGFVDCDDSDCADVLPCSAPVPASSTNTLLLLVMLLGLIGLAGLMRLREAA